MTDKENNFKEKENKEWKIEKKKKKVPNSTVATLGKKGTEAG